MPLNPIQLPRRMLGEAMARHLAGPEASAQRRRAAAPDATHWFGPDRPIRTVHADASMLIGGIRALLIQTLHPKAMAGVAAHSAYRSDPLGRLQRTGEFLGVTTFGHSDDAAAAAERVRRIHETVRGTMPDGQPYAANDPHLLRWVHVTEADSFLAAYTRYGDRTLSQDERDAYIEDLARVGEAIGVQDPPRSERELRDQMTAYRPELGGSSSARSAARFVLFKPPLPLVTRPGYAVLASAAVGLMPWWTRWPLRLPLLPVAEATVVRVAASAVTKGVRWAMAPD